jgi:peptidoglycan/xylan/chitin deacetylase (PgdA/CDA1 family)
MKFMRENPGIIVTSLDFELCWGVLGEKSLEKYQKNLLGAREVIPKLLNLFEEYQIHATWAIVGLLFFDSRRELLASLSNEKPCCADQGISFFFKNHEIGENEKRDPYRYAPSLIKLIATSPHQEIATHTFSHFCCQDAQAFKADLAAAFSIAKKFNLSFESIIFPKNQIDYNQICLIEEFGLKAYRGNELAWFFRSNSLLSRLLRLIDAYINISGHNSYQLEEIKKKYPYDIPSSRFLRPYSKKYQILEPLRMSRILSDLTFAAQNRLVYHLWWHPHNFGINQVENLEFLRTILDHYAELKKLYNMASLNMKEVSSLLSHLQK